MKKRIENLLHDSRLDLLCASGRWSLKVMLKNLEDGYTLSAKQWTNLQWMEEHIKNIRPHLETLQVNGDNVPVLFVTEVQGKP